MTRLCEFYECIQGEGRFTGTPMWLVRLQGCDVGCPWCDTKESWDGGGFEIDPAIFIPRLREANQAIRWAMITGGEPCLQNLNPFTAALVEAGMRAALETSGTSPITGTLDWITVSPKVGMPGHKEVLQSVLERADEIKMPVGAQRDIDNLLTLLAKGWAQRRAIISLQPLSMSKAATDLCYQACLKHGWNLSLQTQKWIGAR